MFLQDDTKKQRAQDARNGVIYHFTGNAYKVTGRTTDGRRFTIHTDSPHHALEINICDGSKWIKYADEVSFRRFCEA